MSKKACQVYTVNTRRAFYPNRTDADETNFNAFLGCVILSDRVQTGRISFPEPYMERDHRNLPHR